MRQERNTNHAQARPRPSREAGADAPAGPAREIVARAVALLARWDEGTTLQELLPGRGQEVLQNGLLTLFRRRAEIDWVLAGLAERTPRPRLLRLLRWAATEILFVRHLPPPLMVSLATGFARQAWGAAEAGFVNAVLRRLTAEPADALLTRFLAAAPPHVRLGLSSELHAAWASRFAPDELARLAELLQTPAPLTARLRTGAPAPEPAAPGLAPLAAPDWAPATRLFTVADPARFFASAPFAAGVFYVQDPSTLLAPALVAAQPAERIADLCAAPGGKALLLAEALAGQGLLVCADRSPGRLRPLRQNLAGRDRVVIVAADCAHAPLAPASFDAVLLDVPCTNTGVIRRRPDVRWRFTRASQRELVAAQAAILAGAAPLVRPGGRLVYSTCSIEPAENGDQVARFLAAHPGFTRETERQLLPAADHDGAYAACLRRHG